MSNENVLKEEWKVIPEFPNYKISNLGNVLDINGNRALRKFNEERKCIAVLLYKYSNTCPYYKVIADLVGELFVEKPKECNNRIFFKDKDWRHISSDNIEWGTVKSKPIDRHIVDSKGNVFNSTKAFCSKYGVSIRNIQNYLNGNTDKIKYQYLEILRDLDPTYEL
jgi:hypothetical protein